MENPKLKTTQLSSVSSYGYFIFSIFHNLANQLTQLQCELLDCQRILPQSHFEKLQRQLTYINQVVRHSQEVLHRDSPEQDWFDASRVFLQVKKLLSLALLHQRTQLRLDVPDECLFYGDHVILQQILLNLLWNSLEAVADQPVESRFVTLRAKLNNHDLIIEVEDSGTGLPENYEPLKPSDKPNSHGLGLVYVFHHVEKSFGGQVRFTSSKQGTTCSVNLPRLHMEDLPSENEQDYL